MYVEHEVMLHMMYELTHCLIRQTTLLHIQCLFNLTINTLFLHRRPKPTELARVRVSGPRTSRHRLATLRRPHVNRLRVLLRPRVDTNIDSRIQTVCNCLANQADLHDRIIAALLTHVEEKVLGVESLSLLVGVVGRGLFDFP